MGGDQSSTVVAHYPHGGLSATILRGLAATGKPTDRIDADDLVAGDEFHIGGREATSALFDQLGWQSGMQVLDLGCGIGGPVEYLARHRDARVIGVDLTTELIEIARELIRRCGLAEMVDFQVGNGLELPIPDGGVDAACLLHVGMNIEDKSWLIAEVRRVVRPGGWFAVYDLMRGSVNFSALLELALTKANVGLGEGGIPIVAALFGRDGRKPLSASSRQHPRRLATDADQFCSYAANTAPPPAQGHAGVHRTRRQAIGLLADQSHRQ